MAANYSRIYRVGGLDLGPNIVLLGPCLDVGIQEVPLVINF